MKRGVSLLKLETVPRVRGGRFSALLWPPEPKLAPEILPVRACVAYTKVWRPTRRWPSSGHPRPCRSGDGFMLAKGTAPHCAGVSASGCMRSDSP